MNQADIFIFDDLHPEDNAMVQALYSRSPSSVLSHIEKVKEAGSGKFMEQFYIGYGHASIGDCGSTTIFIENASMLVAKAVQDHPLYKGQEASTRYLDFAQQALVDPYDHPASAKILQGWIDLYNQYMPILTTALARHYPLTDAYKSEKAWQKAFQVRAFDTLRSLLPVGTSTLLSWHTDLRQARDHLRELRAHPLEEVRSVATRIFDALKEKYPNSYNGAEMNGDSERYAERNAYADKNALADNFLTVESGLRHLDTQQQSALRRGEVIVDDAWVDIDGINTDEAAALSDRPRGAPLSKRFKKYGNYSLKFLLDFGSFRDLQRHRNGYNPIPVVGNTFGFHKWYDDELQRVLEPADYQALKASIDAQFLAITGLSQSGIDTNSLKDQYLYPMGMACLCELSYSLPQMVYVAELRSGITVHPSLRPIAQTMGAIVSQRHPDLNLYIDQSTDSWSPKRGEQDITAKVA